MIIHDVQRVQMEFRYSEPDGNDNSENEQTNLFVSRFGNLSEYEQNFLREKFGENATLRFDIFL
jgi:hypothetical protein